MEDKRDDINVIVDANPEKMDEFLTSNPGLRSRFTRSFFFADYSVDELADIYLRTAKRDSFEVSEAAVQKLLDVLSWLRSRLLTAISARCKRTLGGVE